MNCKRLLPQMTGLASIMLLLVACGTPQPTPTPVPPTATSTPIPPTATPLPPTPTELPKVKIDVPYAAEWNLFQLLDVYLPEEGEGPFPTILAIHGGGFQAESKNNYRRHASRFNERGYALVSIDYRLAPALNYPAQVQDSFCALAWVHANAATYGFDTERIIAMGESAGGYLAAMLGTVDTPGLYMEGCPHTLPETNWIQGIVSFYGLFDLTSIDGYSGGTARSLELYLGATYSDVPVELLAEMSPMSWVDGSEPPSLLIHGLADTGIPAWLAEDFASALEENGAEVELLLLQAGHGFITDEPLSSPAVVQSLEATEAFLAALFEE